MTSAQTLEPASTTTTDVHIDFHVSATGPFKHRVFSPEEVKIDLGAISMFMGGEALDRMIEELMQARDERAILERSPDPLPDL